MSCWHCNHKLVSVMCTECGKSTRWICSNPKCEFFRAIPVITDYKNLDGNPNFYKDYLKTAKRYNI